MGVGTHLQPELVLGDVATVAGHLSRMLSSSVGWVEQPIPFKLDRARGNARTLVPEALDKPAALAKNRSSGLPDREGHLNHRPHRSTAWGWVRLQADSS